MATVKTALRMPRTAVGRRSRGATLFETMIAVFLFTVLVLGVTLTLVSEAGRRIQHSGERAGELAASRVLDRLRTDVWASSRFVVPYLYDPDPIYYEGPLVLSGHSSGYEIAYGVDDGVLQRALRQTGEEPEIDEVLRGVVTFQWRFLDGVGRRSVELEIHRTESATFRGPDDAAARPTEIVERIVLSPRRVQASSW